MVEITMFSIITEFGLGLRSGGLQGYFGQYSTPEQAIYSRHQITQVADDLHNVMQ